MPPLCKGRWYFRKKMTEGLSVFSSIFGHRTIPQSASPDPFTQVGLYKDDNEIKFRTSVFP